LKAFQKNSCWLYNKGKTDIVLAELGVTLKRGHALDIFASNPALHPVQVKHSERYGLLKKLYLDEKIIKLGGPPEEQKSVPVYKVSTEMIRDRSRSCVTIDPSEKDFIDHLEEEFMNDVDDLDDHALALLNERFANQVDLDGFVDDNFIDDNEE